MKSAQQRHLSEVKGLVLEQESHTAEHRLVVQRHEEIVRHEAVDLDGVQSVVVQFDSVA